MGRSSVLVGILKVFDLVAVALCFATAGLLVSADAEFFSVRQFLALRFSLGNIIIFGGFVALWHLLFSGFGLYEGSLSSSAYRRAIDILKATSIGTCAIVAVAVPFKISFVDARFLLMFWTSVSFLSFCSRVVAKVLLARYNSKEDGCQVPYPIEFAGLSPDEGSVDQPFSAVRAHCARLASEGIKEIMDAGADVAGVVLTQANLREIGSYGYGGLRPYHAGSQE